MKLFSCNECGQLLYFENIVCTHCHATLGFLPSSLTLAALQPCANGLWQVIGDSSGPYWKQCKNYSEHAVCNWMVDASSPEEFCLACRLDRTIPDLSRPNNGILWQKLETEKRRLIYSLQRLGLPIQPARDDPDGLAFDFLADQPSFNERGRVLTGHKSGIITINIAEADPVVREQMRYQMAEPYRTVLGHLRHESGHYYWDRLIRNSHLLGGWRAVFGNEAQDYTQALEAHYINGPCADWSARYISAYASSHPWEDWAETWAHYLHIVDTLETAHQFGLRTHPLAGNNDNLSLADSSDAYDEPTFEHLFNHWLPLAIALNSLNRSMGHEPVYPFVLTETVKNKLSFVHRCVHSSL